ncbi:MAG TPA: hypothetical protein VM432_12260 [Bdellovibrionales bacterium]|nr:hypothetical protein [Bdellovibrionales bacterium]
MKALFATFLWFATSMASAAEIKTLESYSLKASKLDFAFIAPGGCLKAKPSVWVDLKVVDEHPTKAIVDMYIHIGNEFTGAVDVCAEDNYVEGKIDLKNLVDRRLQKMGLKREDVLTRQVMIRPNKNFYPSDSESLPEWEALRSYRNRNFLP